MGMKKLNYVNFLKKSYLKTFFCSSELASPYESFTRIPYMKPPIGNLRFRVSKLFFLQEKLRNFEKRLSNPKIKPPQDPQPPEPWNETLDCTQEGPRFPQIDFTFQPQDGDFYGDLDSMHINVYTNNLEPSQPYPVLVWIHGGGFR